MAVSNKQSPFMVYGALVTALAASITSMVDLKLASDPSARPDPCTGTDCRELDRRIKQLSDKFDEYRLSHAEWGRERAGKQDAERTELYHRVDKIEKQLENYRNQIHYYRPPIRQDYR